MVDKHIPGPTRWILYENRGSIFSFYLTTILDKKPTFEMRGTWDVKDAFMAGPFVTYVFVEDK